MGKQTNKQMNKCTFNLVYSEYAETISQRLHLPAWNIGCDKAGEFSVHSTVQSAPFPPSVLDLDLNKTEKEDVERNSTGPSLYDFRIWFPDLLQNLKLTIQGY